MMTFKIIEDWHTVLGDTHARSGRTTRATELLREIKEAFKAQYRGQKRSVWIPLAIEKFRNRLCEEFPLVSTVPENERILIKCTEAALRERILATKLYGYPGDEEPKFGTAKWEESLTFSLNSRDAPKKENEVKKYRAWYNELRDLPVEQRPPSDDLVDFEETLEFFEKKLARKRHLDDASLEVLNSLTPLKALKEQWRIMTERRAPLDWSAPGNTKRTAALNSVPDRTNPANFVSASSESHSTQNDGDSNATEDFGIPADLDDLSVDLIGNDHWIFDEEDPLAAAVHQLSRLHGIDNSKTVGIIRQCRKEVDDMSPDQSRSLRVSIFIQKLEECERRLTNWSECVSSDDVCFLEHSLRSDAAALEDLLKKLKPSLRDDWGLFDRKRPPNDDVDGADNNGGSRRQVRKMPASSQGPSGNSRAASVEHGGSHSSSQQRGMAWDMLDDNAESGKSIDNSQPSDDSGSSSKEIHKDESAGNGDNFVRVDHASTVGSAPDHGSGMPLPTLSTRLAGMSLQEQSLNQAENPIQKQHDLTTEAEFDQQEKTDSGYHATCEANRNETKPTDVSNPSAVSSRTHATTVSGPRPTVTCQPSGPIAPPVSQPATGKKLSIKELCVVAHSVGINTQGMERGELERVVTGISRSQPASSPEVAPPKPAESTIPVPTSTSTGATVARPVNLKRERIVELQKLAHGAGINTCGMEFDELERTVAAILKQQPASSFQAAPPKPAESPTMENSPPKTTEKTTATPVAQSVNWKKERIMELRKLAHGAGINTCGMEFEELERLIADLSRQHEEQENIRKQKEERERQRVEHERRVREEEEKRRRQHEQEYCRLQEAWLKQLEEENHKPMSAPGIACRGPPPQAANQTHMNIPGSSCRDTAPKWHQQQFVQHFQQPAQQFRHAPPNSYPGHSQRQNSPLFRPRQFPGEQETSHQNDNSTQRIKRAVLVHWALQPPAFQTLRRIEELITTVHTVLPPAFGVPKHEYFSKWKAVTAIEVHDERQLEKHVRKLRFFLHPDKIPEDMTAEQTYVCRLVWDVTNDAFQEHKRRKEECISMQN